MPRFLCISCEIFARPIYLSAAYAQHAIDVVLLEIGLHDHPEKLRASIQDQIDQVEGKAYDAIILAYGLCGNGTAGLRANSTKLVIPRTHDCIALLLGDRKRYQEELENAPGTYWFSRDFIERVGGTRGFEGMGSFAKTELSEQHQSFITKFGKENADYLMETMGAWQSHYTRAGYIDTGIIKDIELEGDTQAQAEHRGWIFEKFIGDLVFFRKLLNGEWTDDNSDFLVIPPHQTIDLTYDENIFVCGVNSDV